MIELYIHDRVTHQEDRRTGTLLEGPAEFKFPAGAVVVKSKDGSVVVQVPKAAIPAADPYVIHVEELPV